MNQAAVRPDGVSLLAILFYLLAALSLIGGIFLVAASDSLVDLVEEEATTDIPDWVMNNMRDLLTVGGVIAIIIGLFYAITGWGLWNLKSWSRLVAIILAVISLLNIPIGTIIGLVVLWYLFKPEIKQAFHD
jgi:uncharacterized membrane protein (DUF2068 family)